MNGRTAFSMSGVATPGGAVPRPAPLPLTRFVAALSAAILAIVAPSVSLDGSEHASIGARGIAMGVAFSSIAADATMTCPWDANPVGGTARRVDACRDPRSTGKGQTRPS